MQITHQEARHFIQLRADNTLIATEQQLLKAHLKVCVDCTDYANQIQEMEAILRTTMRKHWQEHHLTLPIKVIKEKVSSGHASLGLLTTRSALIGATLLFFAFVFLHFTSPYTDSQNSISVGISAVPTPMLLFTGTQNNFESCQLIKYAVTQDDTLGSVARQFVVPENVILDLNHLQPGIVQLPARLLIPVCELTPTGTSHPPTFTNTPSQEPFTYTPG